MLGAQGGCVGSGLGLAWVGKWGYFLVVGLALEGGHLCWRCQWRCLVGLRGAHDMILTIASGVTIDGGWDSDGSHKLLELKACRVLQLV